MTNVHYILLVYDVIWTFLECRLSFPYYSWATSWLGESLGSVLVLTTHSSNTWWKFDKQYIYTRLLHRNMCTLCIMQVINVVYWPYIQFTLSCLLRSAASAASRRCLAMMPPLWATVYAKPKLPSLEPWRLSSGCNVERSSVHPKAIQKMITGHAMTKEHLAQGRWVLNGYFFA